jgi:two-component system response regulator CpxR
MSMARSKGSSFLPSTLRKKLPERADGQPRFKTVRGRGYLWLEQA